MSGNRPGNLVRRAIPSDVRALLRRARNAARRFESRRASRKRFEDRASTADVAAGYRLLLGRTPDERGYLGYAALVRGRAVTVDELTRYFVNSPEFWDRWQRIGGAVPGRLVRVDLSSGGTLYVRDDDSVGVEMHRQRSYEPHVTREVLRTLRRGSVFVDVGASTGYFTVLAAHVVGPEGEVVACEPGPQNQSVLLLNTVVNALANVRLVPCAVSDESAVLVYHRLGGGNGAIAAFDGTPQGMGGGELVQARRLDDILTGIARVDLVKIDVEGAEGRVLAGAGETLRRHTPTLLFEFSPPALQTVSGVRGEDLLAGLAGLGYRFRVLGAGSPRAATAEAVLHAYRRQAGDHIDVMASVAL